MSPISLQSIETLTSRARCGVAKIPTRGDAGLTSYQSGTDGVKLGDFDKLHSALQERSHEANATVTPSCHLERSSEVFPSAKDDNTKPNVGLISQGLVKSKNHLKSPSSTAPKPLTVIAAKATSHIGKALSYQFKSCGPVFCIKDISISLKRQHEFPPPLMRLRAGDAKIMAESHQTASNGIHVFLDMSNINISFHNVLRASFSINAKAYFVPLPQLNLQFLTEILVRGRKVMALNAGCSVLPHRQHPPYIRDLQSLGYRVDVRERKLASDSKRLRGMKVGSGDVSSSDELNTSRNTMRYIEELVDETLQMRIAESVMEYFQNEGTLVLATGDAQPAKYSDGFFTYAERALRMGWHVEIISWNTSLSSRWKQLGFADTWGSRFRIIELDDFLADLLL